MNFEPNFIGIIELYMTQLLRFHTIGISPFENRLPSFYIFFIDSFR
jgi:hypothetical protein